MEEIYVSYFLAQTGHRDAEPVAVFGHCAPGQLVALLLEPGQYGFVAQWCGRVLCLDECAYGSEYGARRGLFVPFGADTLVEEEFQRIDASRRGDIFACGGA